MKKFIILLCFGVLCTATLAGQPKKRQKVARPAQSIIVLNQTTNKITHIHNANTVRSMASITKLMTAMVVLDTIANLENLIKLKRSYLGRSEFTIRELLDLLLVRSDNHVAEILSRKILTNRSAFITAMNYKASSIGMSNATFIDPSGLNPNNKATAKDIATLVMAANTYTTIREISSQKQIDIKVQTKHQIKTINKFNTNYAILNEFDNMPSEFSLYGFRDFARCI